MRPEYIETEPLQDIHVPRPLLVGAGLLALVALGAAAAGRRPGAAVAPAPAPVESRALRFEDAPDGAVLVRDAADGALVARFGVGEGGFVRGALRGLARRRMLDGVSPAVPFLLTRAPDGRLALHDSTTRSHVDLAAFGPTNAGVFARFFEPADGATVGPPAH